MIGGWGLKLLVIPTTRLDRHEVGHFQQVHLWPVSVVFLMGVVLGGVPRHRLALEAAVVRSLDPL